MARASQHDAWQAGDNYDRYMGRWSRQVAPRFLDWLHPARGLDWVDVGCGTGALSAAIVAGYDPKSLIGLDPSEGFLEKARLNVPDPRVEFRVGDAQMLAMPSQAADIVVSGLMLNFVPRREEALREMARVARPGGRVAFYVWDYPSGGVEFMRAFWTIAVDLDPAAQDLTENRRFPFCTRDNLAHLARQSGLAEVEDEEIEIATRFENFDDFWRPFTLGTGPAPAYCANLPADRRRKLREKLKANLPYADDGSIPFKARAWAVRGRAVE
ncbi:class I SAM-dependent methyltransferase [Neorhizobium petrolearium]|uniref:Class I SAM-dependent methyltransferase n=1 Tax=Neorhizobium petrolearium TaxID=515361 RepID=A0ABY8M669_9HYPH|nr:class I SAM-dependent methyltransferase [Neorhizobium petrolearium]MCC2608992.1 class I SAM-dependent methyltransferase [Neorhizobium petrolearium]WGI69234.1 class I SAM-dependent methyltransferase [Neorhizobium petrolearium]